MPASRPLRILHALAPGAIGGIESVVRLLALGQREAGHSVDLVTILDEASHPYVDLLRAHELSVHPIVAPDRAYREERAAFRALLEKLDPEIVHTHGTRPDVLLSGVARARGCTTVTTVHGFSGGGWKNRLYESLQRRAMRSMSAVAAVSQAQCPILERAGVRKDRLHVVPNAWRPLGEPLDRESARRELGLPPKAPVIGYVGRLSFEKGPDLLVEALAQMRVEGDGPGGAQDWVASFLGDGGEASSLHEQATRLEVGDRIHWHGAVADAWRFFRAFDVLVMPSRTEGTPISLFEAMHARVPLVLARVGGIPAVVDPVAGAPPMATLVAPLDVAGLAAAIRRKLEDPSSSAREVESAATRLATEYAVEPWLARMEAVYAAALGR